MVELISITQNHMDLLKEAIGMCHQKQVSDRVVKHCIEAGHMSVLEHAYASFKVKCSIQTLLQLTRHRHLSFTVQSSRVTNLTDYYKTGDWLIDEMNRDTMNEYMDNIMGSKQEQKAYMLPKAAMYNLVVTGNFRAWYEYLTKRLCARTQTEHRLLAEEIHRTLCLYAPQVYVSCTAPCGNCKEKSCVFHEEKPKIAEDSI